MNDRELTEHAAKAAALRIKWEPVHGCHWIEPGQGIQIDPWTPLLDDAQAFRLAVKLAIDVFPDDCDDGTETVAQWKETIWSREPINGDAYAATRRAIVRAAAEIGKTMP